jgi:hypothetical protein
MIDEYIENWIKKANNDLKIVDAKDLSEFGVDIRYPDDFYIPELDEMRFYF